MFLTQFFRGLFSYLRTNGSHMRQVPLVSLLLLVVFDLFLFVQILDGMEYQGPKKFQPYTMSSDCSSVYNQGVLDPAHFAQWGPQERAFAVSQIVFFIKIREWQTFASDLSAEVSAAPLCAALVQQADALLKSAAFRASYQNFDTQSHAHEEAIARKQEFEEEYQKYLQEMQSGVTEENRISLVPQDKRGEYKNRLAAVQSTATQLEAAIQSIFTQSDVVSYNRAVQPLIDQIKLLEERKAFWFPFVLAVYQSLLIAPLLLFFGLLYRRAARREQTLLTLMMSHAFAITSLFALWVFASLVWEVFPHTLFQTIYSFLLQNGFLIIWNYAMIVVIVFATLALLNLFQKWYTLRQKEQAIQEEIRARAALQVVRVQRGQNDLCTECGAKMRQGEVYCSQCGHQQFTACAHCKTPFVTAFSHCPQCGQVRNTKQEMTKQENL